MLDLLNDVDSPAGEAARSCIAAGGKRMRPLLVLAGMPVSSQSVADWHCAVAIAASVELIHTASLIHDDIIDDAPLRRGRPTIFSEHGTLVATAAGDVLFSRGFRCLTDLRGHVPEDRVATLIARMAAAAQGLAEGEALQAQQERNPSITIAAYIERCTAKTGLLFGVALEMVALACGARPDDVATLRKFGIDMGIAFQIVDDLLDCDDQATSKTLGKRPGTDLLDGTITAPMLFAVEHDHLLASLLQENLSEQDVLPILVRINATDAITRTALLAMTYRDASLAALPRLETAFNVRALAMAAQSAVERLA